MDANIDILKDSIERIQSALMSKLEQYAATTPSPTCLDYVDGELSVTKDRGRKKVKATKQILRSINEEYESLPTCSWTQHLKKHVHPLPNTQ